MTEYEKWLAQDLADPDLMKELREIKNKPDEINDRFYRSLSFGTAGLRGIIGAGTNRMNVYTVGQATQGLANYLNKHVQGRRPRVAIAYDSRIKSEVFAKVSAGVLAANGIAAHIYPWLSPTPTLSFAVRDLRCDAGINVTASHNPAQYNGYKAYGSDGCQITAQMATDVQNEIDHTDIFKDVHFISFDEGVKQGLISVIPESVLDAFLDAVYAGRILQKPCGNLKVVYTPLNGTGRVCCTRIMERLGVQKVDVVPEQEWPDGNFPTCPFPNPEIREALQKGIALCEKTGDDLLIATDPDCDRCGIAVKQGTEYRLMTGNEVGVLLLNFIASAKKEQGRLPKAPVVVTSIVSTDMVAAVAATYGVEVRRVLTGFKYIGDQIAALEAKGEEDRFLLGFEESYGYLSGGYVRDKDAVDATMLICEMASWYKNKGMTLADAMEDLYKTYGYYRNEVLNFGFEGEDGMVQMQQIMERLRKHTPTEVSGFRVAGWSDYQRSVRSDAGKESKINLPQSNVLEYRLENGCKVIVRPSGTEPKIKIYLSAKGKNEAESAALTEKLAAGGKTLLGI
ncbi:MULTISPECIES: phospho-sugar mutase [Caproicibacterium]|uniref:Phosphoglucomutase n=1 Tax=Caproicibacterium lactatifermentans TaxID=2666138 RepID=A0A859DWL1_9FIRM|nr:phospho-sugar mutase [Caproicibacterium lactatifermentans]ARP51173.1 phosphoglucomutase [Ruminococcaceae bacterium CPB6]MDD4806980.1 phospho-sugar mutase [Oscillospiraceae bacterium]QKN24673.1 phospho-sugar mutase [Caproicibacterium lactatifermentans]QKO30172.1 phospho-sugar mutase [Caproicibacterium lactatifermentans]